MNIVENIEFPDVNNLNGDIQNTFSSTNSSQQFAIESTCLIFNNKTDEVQNYYDPWFLTLCYLFASFGI